MGQKANPLSLRLGYIRGWESNWFSTKKSYAAKLLEDHKIRNYLWARVAKASTSSIVIERILKRITINIHTARPGAIIGKGGTEVEQIKEELKKLTGKEVQINVLEIKKPELDAKLVADSIAQQLQARVSYKRAVRQALTATTRVGAQGVKIQLSGRLGGAEIARSEQYKEGRIPLHTLRAAIDYAVAEAKTIYGKIGTKVWIFKGEIYQKPDLAPISVSKATEMQNSSRSATRSQQKSRRSTPAASNT
ncbi:MAG: 30S ribosomal protein S3 [Bacteroidota bacterium]